MPNKREKVLGNCPKGRLFLISAPAGTGKTTLVGMLKEEFPCIKQNVSYTTRKPRHNEQDGVDYHFIDKGDFDKKVEEGFFLEHVEFSGNHYGTSKKWVEEHLNCGEHIIMVIDTQGAHALKGHFPHCSIFIAPPSLEELKRRLVTRETECEKGVGSRLEIAKSELQKRNDYDYQIINDRLDVAYQVLRSIFIAEEHKTTSYQGEIEWI